MSKMEPEPILLTVPEAAAMLNIKRSLAWKLIGNGDIPCVRLGRAVRVPKAALLRLVAIQSGKKERA